MLAERDEPLGAVRRQTVAVLFVDIVGFTRMAETMTPEAVVTMLREFHERMTAQIFACGGTIEKYIGDEIFAVFGLPTASADDAANALQLRRPDADGARRLERRARRATASRRSRSASASITGRRCSAMSAASTACPSP